MRNTHKILVGKLGGKRQPVRRRHGQGSNISY